MFDRRKSVLWMLFILLPSVVLVVVYWHLAASSRTGPVTMRTLYKQRFYQTKPLNGCAIKWRDESTGNIARRSDFGPFGDAQASSFDIASVVRPWSIMSFEQKDVNCSNEVARTSDFRGDDELPMCNAEFFRQEMAKTDGFPASGTWKGDQDKPWFQPSFCRFNENIQPFALNISSNKSKQNHSDDSVKIAIMGDSNGFYLTDGLLAAVKSMGYQCATTRQESASGGQGRDKNYWATEDISAKYLSTSASLYRASTDRSFTSVCNNSDRRRGAAHGHGRPPSYQFEYISASNLMETTLHMGKAKGSTIFRRQSFGSFAEYVMRHYFRFRGAPDVLLIYSPFHHEKWHASLEKAALDISYLNGLIQTFLPRHTRVVWIPDSRECLSKNPLKIPEAIRDGMHTNLRLHALNGLLYKVLEHRFLDPGSKVHGFLDLGRISCPIECNWHRDGAHMVAPWYQLMANFLLQLMGS